MEAGRDSGSLLPEALSRWAPKLIHGVSGLCRTALCRCLLRGVAVAAVGLAVVTVMIMAMAREAVVSCECNGSVAHPQAARWCFQGRERLAWLG